MAFDIFITLLLVLLNGFFVAAEFSIVKVRYAQIQLKAETGNKLAKKAEHIIKHLDTYLSATQLGITFASLGLGWIGEPVVGKIILSLLHLFNISITPELLHTISLPTAFLLITMLHIIFGELAPKSIAIRKAEATTLAIVYPLYWFYIIFRPFIWLMNSLSNIFLNLIGIKPVGDHEIHSIDELRLLVNQSKEGGVIESENYQIIKNAFDFTDHNVKQIMIPRQQIFSIDVHLPSNKIVERIIQNGYSRVPVFQHTIDNIIGIIYAKDVFREYYKNPDFKIKDLIHPPFYAFETKRISEVLNDFQKQHIHLAVVIDEFGGTQGIITLEDILEELVGEIQDEDDDERLIVEETQPGIFTIQATQPLEDINERLPKPLTISENYSTLSGLLLYHWNKIPKHGEHIVIDNYKITITRIHHRTIQVVKAQHITPEETTVEEK